MPTSKIKKDSREGKGSVPALEHKWDEAKDDAGKKGGKQNWPLTMYIYKKKTHQANTVTVELNAATRLAADTSNFDDHPGKAKAQALTDLVEKSLRKAGCRVSVSPNKLLNRRLTGPFRGYFFTLKTDAPYSDCAQMMEDAGWVLKSREKQLWTKPGQQSFILQVSHEGVEGSRFFI
jgi:hypothetical protein